MFKVGQPVWCVMFGKGVVLKILPNESAKYPLVVEFPGVSVDYYTLDGKYTEKACFQALFSHPVEVIKKLSKPSINWKHVDGKFNYLTEDSDGAAFLYEEKPFPGDETWGVFSSSSKIVEASMFASFTPGTCEWKDSLIKRPEVN